MPAASARKVARRLPSCHAWAKEAVAEGWCSVEELVRYPAAHGGTAAILSAEAPAPLDGWDFADAVVISAENTLT